MQTRDQVIGTTVNFTFFIGIFEAQYELSSCVARH
jgi:hypothetical protein